MSDIFTRSRRVNERVPTSWDYTQNAGGTVTEGSFASDESGMSSQMDDNVNPSWRRRQRQGLITMSGCCLRRSTIDVTPGSLSYSEPGYGIVWNGDACGMVAHGFDNAAMVWVEEQIPQLRDLSLIKAYAKINESTIGCGEYIKEFETTLSMLKSPMLSARKQLARVIKRRQYFLSKSKRVASVSDLAKASSDAWLETIYGWKPIFADVEKIHNRVSDLDRTLARRMVARASERIQSHTVKPFSVPFKGPLGVLNGVGQTDCLSKLSVHAGVIYDVKNHGQVSNSQYFGTRAEDIPVTAWQIMPYSFVIDWFVNVETWIKAVTPKVGVTLLSNWTTSVNEVTSKSSGIISYYWPTVPPRTVTGNLGTRTYTRLDLERETNRLLPGHPQIQANMLGLTRTISALSLLVTPIISGLTKFAGRR